MGLGEARSEQHDETGRATSHDMEHTIGPSLAEGDRFEELDEETDVDKIKKPTTARFVNNRNGTSLSTIKEQQSYNTLDTLSDSASMKTPVPVPCASTSRQAVRKRISKSLDDAILEFRNIFARSEGVTNTSSHLSLSDAAYARPATPTYPPFCRSSTPVGVGKWPGDQDLLYPQQDTYTQLHRTQSHQSASRGLLRAVRDFFRTTTPLEHGQTAFSRNHLHAARPRRLAEWRPPQNSFNYQGHHPFERDENDRPPSDGATASRPDRSSQKASGSSVEASGLAEAVTVVGDGQCQVCSRAYLDSHDLPVPCPIIPILKAMLAIFSPRRSTWHFFIYNHASGHFRRSVID